MTKKDIIKIKKDIMTTYLNEELKANNRKEVVEFLWAKILSYSAYLNEGEDDE